MTSPSPQLSDADLELLSAYIDRQLAAHEREALEQRLEREPELRAALVELRTTVALLQDLAPARPPRSFTLDPAVAQRRRFDLPGWLSGLWLAPALVAVICALAITALFVGRGGTATSVMQPAAGDFQAAAAATPAPAMAQESAPESAAAPAPAAEALAPEGAGAPVAASAATPAPESAPAAAAPPPAEVGAAATAQADMMLGEAPAGGAPAMSATVTAQETEPRVAEEPAQASAATPEPALLATSGVVASETLRLPPPEPDGTPTQPPAGGGPGLWIVILALIVLLGVGGVWVARRRH